MPVTRSITVYGASGHTGRFVVAELLRRGWSVVISGRDRDRLDHVEDSGAGVDRRVASVDDPNSLDRALQGSAAVINCAGPFARTAAPVIEAALRARIPYLDVAAEIEANLDTFANYAEPARDAGITIIPAMAFFGGLGDLLATAAAGDWPRLDEISIAYGLSSWEPTRGTRAAGQVSRERRDGRRIVFADGKFELRDDAAPIDQWQFPPPLGQQDVVAEFTMADTVTISRHIDVPEIRSYMTRAAVRDLTNPDTPPPSAADDWGRSAQTFLVEVVARSGPEERRAIARGRDIYAISAPLVVEAAERVLSRSGAPAGIYTAGAFFDPREFLEALSPEHVSVRF
jgi:short subunit dehydrogenase-like uncharacterized protein